jgi:hypothetical protein
VFKVRRDEQAEIWKQLSIWRGQPLKGLASMTHFLQPSPAFYSFYHLPIVYWNFESIKPVIPATWEIEAGGLEV